MPFLNEDSSNDEEAAVLLTSSGNYLVTIRGTIHTFQYFTFCFAFNVKQMIIVNCGIIHSMHSFK